ncbi:uncharacterized protein LOC121393588 [Xenopus laevis]|uniref:Uncharacterized protein LOC121393588 n=1 Tax=Xenopus laevis TaxID=8355 RepID=A0A8J1KQ51_XENLA|nr:uncharacterized protein LOC121393588 [Xenopus laevis]
MSVDQWVQQYMKGLQHRKNISVMPTLLNYFSQQQLEQHLTTGLKKRGMTYLPYLIHYTQTRKSLCFWSFPDVLVTGEVTDEQKRQTVLESFWDDAKSLLTDTFSIYVSKLRTAFPGAAPRFVRTICQRVKTEHKWYPHVLACVALVVLQHQKFYIDYRSIQKIRIAWKPAVEALCIAGLAKVSSGNQPVQMMGFEPSPELMNILAHEHYIAQSLPVTKGTVAVRADLSGMLEELDAVVTSDNEEAEALQEIHPPFTGPWKLIEIHLLEEVTSLPHSTQLEKYHIFTRRMRKNHNRHPRSWVGFKRRIDRTRHQTQNNPVSVVSCWFSSTIHKQYIMDQRFLHGLILNRQPLYPVCRTLAHSGYGNLNECYLYNSSNPNSFYKHRESVMRLIYFCGTCIKCILFNTL